MPVENPTIGTMPNAEGTKPPEAEGKTPEGGKEVSAGEERLYTQKQLDAFIHATKSETGRTAKELERERDTLKAQLASKEGELEDNANDIADLQKKLEDMSSDDPKRFDALKELTAARNERRQLKTRERELEAKEGANAERIAKADAFEVEVLCESIADEYEGGDSKILHSICKTAGVKDEEAIRNLADTLWSKQKATSKKAKEPLKTYSGYTEGGGKESLEDLLEQAKHLKGKTPAQVADLQKKITEARKQLIR